MIHLLIIGLAPSVQDVTAAPASSYKLDENIK